MLTIKNDSYRKRTTLLVPKLLALWQVNHLIENAQAQTDGCFGTTLQKTKKSIYHERKQISTKDRSPVCGCLSSCLLTKNKATCLLVKYQLSEISDLYMHLVHNGDFKISARKAKKLRNVCFDVQNPLFQWEQVKNCKSTYEFHFNEN